MHSTTELQKDPDSIFFVSHLRKRQMPGLVSWETVKSMVGEPGGKTGRRKYELRPLKIGHIIILPPPSLAGKQRAEMEHCHYPLCNYRREPTFLENPAVRAATPTHSSKMAPGSQAGELA